MSYDAPHGRRLAPFATTASSDSGPPSTRCQNAMGRAQARPIVRLALAVLGLSVGLRRDQMRDLGLAVEVEALRLRLQHAVRIGDTLVLAHVLQP